VSDPDFTPEEPAVEPMAEEVEEVAEAARDVDVVEAEPEPVDEAEREEEELLFDDVPAVDGVGERLEREVVEAAQRLEGDLAAIAAERDEFRALAQQIQADFENYRKRVIRQQTDHLERAAEALVDKLLPVLDACDAAMAHGAADVEPVYAALFGILEKEGLERVDPAGEPFDPTVHEAVMHEEGEGEPTVAEVLRTGYLFKGRVLRAAMVKVAG
jgi:molecular chaperone GrpE